MDYPEFEQRIQSIVPTHDYNLYCRHLSRVAAAKRCLFIQALQYGFTLDEVFSMAERDVFTEAVLHTSICQKTRDNISEIQA